MLGCCGEAAFAVYDWQEAWGCPVCWEGLAWWAGGGRGCLGSLLALPSKAMVFLRFSNFTLKCSELFGGGIGGGGWWEYSLDERVVYKE